ncbi:MAG: alpha/beta hydrolase [Dehalococcoidia bacterium]
MPFADNDGIRIHYQVEGEGPPLLLYHGAAGSLDDWRHDGYVEELNRDYQLILMDGRGHGASDKPHDPEAYYMEHLVGDVVAVLDDLGIGSAHYFGFSRGGYVGFNIAKLAAERVRSLIIGGANPKWKPPAPNVKSADAGPEALVAVIERSRPVSPAWKDQLMANDFEALSAASKGSSMRPDLEDDLPSMTMPFLVYGGEFDGNVEDMEYADRLPNATFVSLPGLDHLQSFSRSDLVLPHVKKFLARVSQA